MTRKELFTELEFTDEKIVWKGGEYVRAWKNDKTIMLDGEFTPEQLRVLADWVEGKIND